MKSLISLKLAELAEQKGGARRLKGKHKVNTINTISGKNLCGELLVSVLNIDLVK